MSTDKKINLPNRIHAHAEKKVGKLDRCFKADAEATIIFNVEKDRGNVELTVRPGNTVIRVSENTSDIPTTIDAAVSPVECQPHKNEVRLERQLCQDAFVRTVDAEKVSSLAPEEEKEEFRIVHIKHLPIKHVTVEEAVFQMNLVDCIFFVFKNTNDDGAFVVVYKHNDGGYGLTRGDT